MALFNVKRYEFDGDDLSHPKPNPTPLDIIQQLNLVAKRKSLERVKDIKTDNKKYNKNEQSEEGQHDIEETHDFDEPSSVESSAKKRRKHKHKQTNDILDANEASVNDEKEEISDVLPKKLKKAKDRKESVGDDDNMTDVSKPVNVKNKIEPNRAEDIQKSLENNTPDNFVENIQKSKKKKKSKKLSKETKTIQDNLVNDFSETSLSEKDSELDSGSLKTDKDILDIPKKTNITNMDIDSIDTATGDTEHEEHEKAVTEAEIDEAVNNESFPVIGEFKRKKIQKVDRHLPDWLSQPSVVNADLATKGDLSLIKGLDEDIRQKLKENGISYFFPVQAQIIPVLLGQAAGGFMLGNAGYRPPDICCSAPTGSGKTLAFVLPIVQSLKARVVCRVRALIVLPVQDLAKQVYKVFLQYTLNTKLKVSLMTGQKQFHQEQNQLVNTRRDGVTESLVDIIVATPGRLVDHINNTKGFELQHLRFLVIDEADRVTEMIKQDWLSQVENAANTSIVKPLTAASAYHTHIPFQKLLFSATLSQNPEKLEQLKLFQPKLFTSTSRGRPVKKHAATQLENKSHDEQEADSITTGEFAGKYTTPAGLKEYFIQISPSEKPLALMHYLYELHLKRVLCFTNTVDSTNRLYHLLQTVGGLEVREFSSKLNAHMRERLLKQFSLGKIDILICSDAMARGMDIEGVQYVISYDYTPYIKTYIHRVGRTARAGKPGTAFTFLEKKEIFHFKKMIQEAGKPGVEEVKMPNSKLKPWVATMQEALKKLPDLLKAEKRKR